MKNVIVNIPNKGDIVFLDGEKKVRFIAYGTYDRATLPQGSEIVGVVGLRQGKQVTIINKNQTDLVWSEAYKWKVKGWKLDGQPHTSTISFYESQHKPSNPTFTYQGTKIAEVVASLLGWFNTYFEESGLRYNAYALDDNTIQVVLEKYASWYQYVFNMSGLSVDYDVAEGQPRSTNGYVINGKGGYYKGMNWDKFVSYMRTTDASSFNPAEPVVSLPTNPVSLPAYLGVNCEYLRGIYGEGEEGWLKILATYMVQHPTMRGVFGEGFKDGEAITRYLAEQTFMKTDGVTYALCPAAKWCADLAYGNASLAKGRWHLPTMDELAKLYKDVKLDYSDKVNASLTAIGGSKLSFRDVWSCCRSDVIYAWSFGGAYGFADGNFLSAGLGVVALLLYNLNECER